MGRKIAVVLFNLGGPDKPSSVQPFLQNLFRDAAIIRAPLPIRWFLARFISRSRAGAAKKNYAMMDADGGSPLLRETEAQAEILEKKLAAALPGDEVKCFIAMRYWHPLTEKVAAEVKRWNADEVVLLPLYPQFSTTTTGSSLIAWKKAFGSKTRTVCCYPFEENFLSAHVERIMDAYRRAGSPETVTLLLSAHGLPEQVIREGDPYQWQCEAVSEMIAGRVPAEWDVKLCYQSRVGPMKWIGPATEAEVEHAAKASAHILIAPIAFVSEHIETLVELGEEYRLVAEKAGAASYTRVDALGTHPDFITTLKQEALAALDMKGSIRSCAGGRLCPGEWTGCPHAAAQHQSGKRMVAAAH